MGLTGALNATAVTLPIMGAITVGKLALFGAMLALGGVSQLMAPSAEVNDYKAREDKQLSFLFNAPVNRRAQGGAMPVIIGRYRTGSIMVSAGLQLHETGGGGDNSTWFGRTMYNIGMVNCTAKYSHVNVNPPPNGTNDDGLPVYRIVSGFSVAFTFSPVGWPYVINNIVIDGVSKGPITVHLFSVVSANHTIVVAMGYAPDYPC